MDEPATLRKNALRNVNKALVSQVDGRRLGHVAERGGELYFHAKPEHGRSIAYKLDPGTE